jgi:hypothetical protein
MKNKTLAAWLAFLGGPLGLHRFYLFGIWDTLGWMLPVPTALGIYGVQRVQEFGLDDVASWLLIPLAGFCFAGCALNAIVYALMTKETWNAKFNPECARGCSCWSNQLDDDWCDRFIVANWNHGADV